MKEFCANWCACAVQVEAEQQREAAAAAQLQQAQDALGGLDARRAQLLAEAADAQASFSRAHNHVVCERGTKQMGRQLCGICACCSDAPPTDELRFNRGNKCHRT